MRETRRIGRAALALFVVAFVFANPYTRQAVLWLLPLGSGIDDLIEIAALMMGSVLAVFWIIRRKS